MANYVLSCCSTCDLTAEHLQQRDINVIFFHYELDGKMYNDDFGSTIPYHDFYQAMAEDKMTRTSQVNTDEFKAYFTKFVATGRDVLHLCLSSGISGVYNSAAAAAAEVNERYPDRRVVVIDSLCASCGYGLLMDRLADLRDEGKTLDEVAAFAKENRTKVQHWFFTSDLKYLVRGGRVSKVAGAFGTMLNICPLMWVDKDGKLAAREKVRTKRRVIRTCADRVGELIENGADYNGKVYINHSDCVEDAKALRDIIVSEHPKMAEAPRIGWVGTTIGSHTGPGLTVICFWGAERT